MDNYELLQCLLILIIVMIFIQIFGFVVIAQ